MSPVTCSVAEAAQALGLSDDAIRGLLDTGVLPEVLPGATRRRLIPRRAIDQLVELAMAEWDPTAAAAQIRSAS